MKKTRIVFFALSVVLILSTAVFTHFFGNMWLLATGNGYFIPAESNIFTFNPTKWNSGSGDWWLFGEDGKYYYALNRDSTAVPPYFNLRKGSEPAIFNKTDYRLWEFVVRHTGKEYIEQIENEYGTVEGRIVRQTIRTLHLPDSLCVSELTRNHRGEYGLQDTLWTIIYYDQAKNDSVKNSFTYPLGMWWNDWALTRESHRSFRSDGQMNYFSQTDYGYDGTIPLSKIEMRRVYDNKARLIERVESSISNHTLPEWWTGDSTKIKYLYNEAGVLIDSIVYKGDRYGWEPADDKKRYTLVQAWKYKQTQLSQQFDIEMEFKHYVDTITTPYFADSAFVRLHIKDKLTGDVFDRVSLNPLMLLGAYYENKNDGTSYTTGFRANRQIVDNYFGNIVVADLNFDGKDDIAVLCDGGGNAGPSYAYYIQTNGRKFVVDNYLTFTMSYFPTEIDPLHRQLTTYAHASAVSVCKCVYQTDSVTNKWRRISKKFIGDF